MQPPKHRIRLVSVVWYQVFPSIFGGQKGIAEFLLALSRHIQLHLVCSENNELNEPGFTWEGSLPVRKRQFIDPGCYRILQRAIKARKATHLMIEHPYYGLWALLLSYRNQIPLVVHSHNLEFSRFRQLGKWWWPVLFVLERLTHRNARLSLFKTNKDRQEAIRIFGLDPVRTHLVPFGLNRIEGPGKIHQQEARKRLQKTYGIPEGNKLLYFCGTLDYAPNALALQSLTDILLPLLSAAGLPYTLLVTGRNEYPAFAWVNELRHEALIMAGQVPDVEPFYMGADIFVNPVTKGGGVKVKVLEALSFGLPVVSYASGASGIDPEVCGGQLMVLPDGDIYGFVRTLQQALEKGKGNIPGAFFEAYSWERITQSLAEILCTL